MREMRRRAAVEPVIGHIRAEHRMGRNYPQIKGRDGDRINAVLAAAGRAAFARFDADPACSPRTSP